MQKEPDVNYALTRYKNDLIEHLETSFKIAEDNKDPLAFITSAKGKWIFNNDLVDSDRFANILFLATEQLNQNLRHTNSHYRCNNDQANIYFYIDNSQELTWNVISNQVKVPLFKLMYENDQKMANLQKQIKANKSKLRDTKMTIEHPDVFLDKGLYLAYLKSVFAKRHYQSECQTIISNLIIQQQTLSTNLKQRNELSQSLKQQEEKVNALIHSIELLTDGFPYHINYQKYLNVKNGKK